MAFYEVNYLAVLVAGILNMAIGALWYSPLMFGKPWMKLMKFTDKDMKKAKEKVMAKSYVISFIASLIIAYVLGIFVKMTYTTTLIGGAMLGIFVWVGFVAAIMIKSILWEGKSLELYWINAGQYFVTLIVMGIILGVWS